jgi:hypothetical protein
MRNKLPLAPNSGSGMHDASSQRAWWLGQTGWSLNKGQTRLLRDIINSQPVMGISCIGACNMRKLSKLSSHVGLPSDRPNTQRYRAAPGYIIVVCFRSELAFRKGSLKALPWALPHFSHLPSAVRFDNCLDDCPARPGGAAFTAAGFVGAKANNSPFLSPPTSSKVGVFLTLDNLVNIY